MSPRRPLRASLTAKLSFVFFAITLLAIAALYLYIAPGLQNRLLNSKLDDLRATAATHSADLRRSVGSSMPLHQVQQLVRSASMSTTNRVTLLSVSRVHGHTELTMQMDSVMGGGGPRQVRAGLPMQAVSTRRIVTGIQNTPNGKLALVAEPVVLSGRVAAVIVFTAPVADVLRTVSTVRHEILIAGGISLLLALLAGMLVSRALARPGVHA